MTPGSFDLKTAKEVIGDNRMRAVEAMARADADLADLAAPFGTARLIDEAPTSYWEQVREQCSRVVYHDAFFTRICRRERKGAMKETAP